MGVSPLPASYLVSGMSEMRNKGVFAFVVTNMYCSLLSYVAYFCFHEILCAGQCTLRIAQLSKFTTDQK